MEWATIIKVFFVMPAGLLFMFVVFGLIINIMLDAKNKAESKTGDVFENIKKAAEHLK